LSIKRQRNFLRTKLRQQRAQLTPQQRITAAESVADILTCLPAFIQSTHIAGYWAVNAEVSLHAIVARALDRKKVYYLPKIGKSRQMDFLAWETGQRLNANRYGIPEPCFHSNLAPHLLDIVLLPLVGFDRQGHRLGTGGGFYDTTFAFLRQQSRPSKPLLIGVGYSQQELEAINPQPWDITLDFIVTERELIGCDASSME